MITSRQNPHFKEIRALQKKRQRDKTQTFIVEGEREIARCKDIVKLYYTEETPFVEKYIGKVQTYQIAQELLDQLSYRKTGVLAIAQQVHPSLEELQNHPVILLLEGIEKPGNVGAILRTSLAAGVTGIILCDCPIDPYNPNVIRSSLGCSLMQQLVVAKREDVFTFLQSTNHQIICTSPQATESCFSTVYKKPCAIVVGSEAYGVTDPWFEKATQTIQIPMAKGADSLNASVSAAIVLYCVQHLKNSR